MTYKRLKNNIHRQSKFFLKRYKKIVSKGNKLLFKYVKQILWLFGISKRRKKQSASTILFFRFVALFSILSFMIGAVSIRGTYAYFTHDITPTSFLGNTGVLGVQLSIQSIADTLFVGQSTTTTTTLSKTNNTNLDYTYATYTTLIGPDTSACDYISVVASNLESTYSGHVNDLTFATSTPGIAESTFTFSIASSVPTNIIGKTCQFEVHYIAWQANVPDNSQGWNDSAKMFVSITISQPTVIPSRLISSFMKTAQTTDSTSTPLSTTTINFSTTTISTTTIQFSTTTVSNLNITPPIDIQLPQNLSSSSPSDSVTLPLPVTVDSVVPPSKVDVTSLSVEQIVPTDISLNK